MLLQSEDDTELYRNITSTSTTLCICCLYYRHKHLLGITFILYLLKLSAGNGFWKNHLFYVLVFLGENSSFFAFFYDKNKNIKEVSLLYSFS